MPRHRRLRFGEALKTLQRSCIPRDTNVIPLGVDFVDDFDGWVRQCDVLLAVIGPGWLEATDPETGDRRLDDEEDFVRIEIRQALAPR